jgi:hypothetical protein
MRMLNRQSLTSLHVENAVERAWFSSSKIQDLSVANYAVNYKKKHDLKYG